LDHAVLTAANQKLWLAQDRTFLLSAFVFFKLPTNQAFFKKIRNSTEIFSFGR